MQDEKPFYKNIRYALPFIIFVILAFVLGMVFQKSMSDKEWNNALNTSIQRYNFTLAGYSKFVTQEALREPFACVLGDGEQMEEIFWNVFNPALNRQPVCFVNIYNPKTNMSNIGNQNARNISIDG